MTSFGLQLVCVPGREDSDPAGWFVVERSTTGAWNTLGEARDREHARELLAEIRERLSREHADAGGDLCRDGDEDGCCDVCGVSLWDATCASCSGIGYHRAGCSESEE
jgi:hypothetical protein